MTTPPQVHFTLSEQMIVVAARLLRDGDVVYTGVGLPTIAALLARRTHAPRLTIIFETGIIRNEPCPLPQGVDTIGSQTGAEKLADAFYINTLAERGLVNAGFVGAGQIDRFGNLNSTVIGSYHKPKTRLPGAGGAPEIASNARQTFVVLKQSPRSFVAELDFKTSIGFGEGHGARARTGARGAGPQAVITDFGLLRPAADTQELQLVACFENVDPQAAVRATGWPLRVADELEVIRAPESEELRVLRELHARRARGS